MYSVNCVLGIDNATPQNQNSFGMSSYNNTKSDIFISGGSDNFIIIGNKNTKSKIAIYKGRAPITAICLMDNNSKLMFSEGEDFSRGEMRPEIETKIGIIDLNGVF